MKKRKTIILCVIILACFLSFYYQDYIPTTQSDFMGLYYYIKDKKTNTPDQHNSTKQIEKSLLNSSGVDSNFRQDDNNTKQENNSNGNSGDNNTNDTFQENPVSLPEILNNYVPFIPQAPFANWDKFHDAACEEASLVMAHYYLEKRDMVFSKEAEKDIQSIGSRMKDKGIADLTVFELKEYAEKIYGYNNWKVIEKPKVNDIEKELAWGNIIIIPLAGREIGNPYFKNPGPLYHMLVISGYNNKKGVFITQDPGTKRGKNFTYKFDVLLGANHDFPGDANKITQGEARVLVVLKK